MVFLIQTEFCFLYLPVNQRSVVFHKTLTLKIQVFWVVTL
jgi:hypothetical protein